MKRKHIIISALTLTGAGTLGLMVRSTIKTIENIVDPTILRRRQNPFYIYVEDEVMTKDSNYPLKPTLWDDTIKQWIDFEYYFSPLMWWEKKKTDLMWRLLQMSKEEDCWRNRVRPLEHIIKRFTLTDSDYNHLAQLCDAKTAVTLARMKDADIRFFRKPFHSPKDPTKSVEGVVNRIFDLLVTLNKCSEHSCIDYFLSKTFPGRKVRPYTQIDCSEFPQLQTVTGSKLFTTALESILHHCLSGNVVSDLVEAGGLQLLYDIYQLDSDNYEIKVPLVQIIVEVSYHPEYLQDLFQTGWIRLLAEWIKDQDQRLSSPAASALSNLEKDCEVGRGFKNATYLLYPTNLEWKKRKVDVVLVHGLMGGPHSTWRKGPHNSELDPWQLIPGIVNQAPIVTETPFVIEPRKPFRKSQDTTKSPIDLDCDLLDFEFVMTDLPLGVSGESNDTFTLTCKEMQEEMANDYCGDSQCWPKDWLPETCSGIRLIGVNYYSTISDWVSWCPIRSRGLLPKAKYLLENLIACGVGDRPIVWITHSMGGLILKHMLLEASNTIDDPRYANFCKNSKAVFFFSTPHFGSPLIAQGNELYAFFFMPSKEVEELKLNSPGLIELHERFKKLVSKYSMKITSFNETKATKFSVWDVELKCLTDMTMDSGTGVIYKLPLGHVDICKPSSRLSFVYQKISSTIRSICKENKCCPKNCL
ncbi:protein SERAC1 [Cimex lectularius]|uniref:Protein SERAC1 n=1 Tax=Cimex lectularius TaxID=79782 RepID=A0A8I6R833_CIMLE|nr:protein SERAC1 [Cimex lectularius]